MDDLRIYLNELWHVDAWVNGGKIPLSPASNYLADAHDGVMTPDENRIFDTGGMPETPFVPKVGMNAFGFGQSPFQRHFEDVEISGFGYPSVVLNGTITQKYEDGLVLCMSNGRVDKWKDKGKVACVRVIDLPKFVNALNAAVGAHCDSGPMQYTKGIQRSHFLKGKAEEWQHEFRLFWREDSPIIKEVLLPSGLTEEIAI